MSPHKISTKQNIILGLLIFGFDGGHKMAGEWFIGCRCRWLNGTWVYVMWTVGLITTPPPPPNPFGWFSCRSAVVQEYIYVRDQRGVRVSNPGQINYTTVWPTYINYYMLRMLCLSTAIKHILSSLSSTDKKVYIRSYAGKTVANGHKYTFFFGQRKKP